MTSQHLVNIFLSMGVALLLSLGIYLGIVVFFVNPYLATSEKLPNIFNFYSAEKGDLSSNVYIIGSSQVREGVNATIIQEIWGRETITSEVYNLGYTGDTPLRRLTELQAMKASHPKIVIIGISYQSFYDNGSIPYDQLLMVADKITLDNASRDLYNADELHWLSLNFFENAYEKRIWVIPAISGLLERADQNSSESLNFKDPFIYTVNETREELFKKLKDYPSEQQIYITFPKEDNRQKEALGYIVRQLQDSGTRVVIVVLPLNPLLEQTINNTDRQDMRAYLNGIDAPWIDFETHYPQQDFIDFVHMNDAGREEFSSDLAKAITPD